MIVFKYKNTNRENLKTVLPIGINAPKLHIWHRRPSALALGTLPLSFSFGPHISLHRAAEKPK